jgi:hypothetical protein
MVMKVYGLRAFASDAEDGLPPMAEVERRFAIVANYHPPWLAPEGMAALAALVVQGVPEANGPETFVMPPDTD